MKNRKIEFNLAWIWWKEDSSTYAINRSQISEVKFNPYGREAGNWIRLSNGMIYMFSYKEMKQILSSTNIGQ